MAQITQQSFSYAVIGGLIPALIWLFFWIKEDCHPEPKRLLFYAFLGGILAIPPALLFSLIWKSGAGFLFSSPVTAGLATLLGLAFIEETSKYALTKRIIFWRKDFNEPVDAMVYLMTAALGFASAENIMYLIPEFAASIYVGIDMGNLRFLGATLLHTLASGTLGFFIAHQFCNSKTRQRISLVTGLLAATLIHTTFNIIILNTGSQDIKPALVLVGIVGIFVIFAFEHIKKVHQTCHPAKRCGGRYCPPETQTLGTERSIHIVH
ncbi:MAG: hypothetical protein A3C80_04275 [Candidatus Ryanbacteria bacterium RIFCSPHIGHO2_02_FULL_45_43]|uniref:Protease PrsW n=1 Tax=Candidatus Ryanbacteria bacterium RIFCSPHIGHO2_01_45_13 TaxID=1802112 RepID=A0A1G2FYA2_9BACT|nr:MAG: hypothetical protein A2718_00300 [Candidatus Ryanbacteria bacterium RIFCSPHIGHO2_01_FULL_44_130]OGZ42807.1 MAG: hypothetical protein A2W41_00610 [Candidatus Ryanbacteria bacterium RIFCSPHIGHO2_01_45_13]OGZ48248.1 MAG: hypothetical protein A3C80_04275 [Candidatus Ryanbacteria bacterium RIFCSPHIGHO2_02_FULL_45_43]OGZ50024.1 MAG: hypothetical protein A3E55_01935 [Candidatus Ryanbacteria bacterium RIFCSPHIGHO2_12_FULL_44_20]OGZ51482.1 MAG: hypothetical protein A3A17_01880 [Candidatus Ryanba